MIEGRYIFGCTLAEGLTIGGFPYCPVHSKNANRMLLPSTDDSTTTVHYEAATEPPCNVTFMQKTKKGGGVSPHLFLLGGCPSPGSLASVSATNPG